MGSEYVLNLQNFNLISEFSPHLGEMSRSDRGVSHAEQNYIRQILPIPNPPLIPPKGGKILSL
jgi:hypothetical protein